MIYNYSDWVGEETGTEDEEIVCRHCGSDRLIDNGYCISNSERSYICKDCDELSAFKEY